MLDNAVGSALETGACRHLAVVLRSEAEFAPVVASFYSLGAKRGAWLVHRAAEVEEDRRALTDAGLDVAGLESENRLVIEPLNLDEPRTRCQAAGGGPRRGPRSGPDRPLVFSLAGRSRTGCVRARDRDRARMGGALRGSPRGHALPGSRRRPDAAATVTASRRSASCTRRACSFPRTGDCRPSSAPRLN